MAGRKPSPEARALDRLGVTWSWWSAHALLAIARGLVAHVHVEGESSTVCGVAMHLLGRRRALSDFNAHQLERLEWCSLCKARVLRASSPENLRAMGRTPR